MLRGCAALLLGLLVACTASPAPSPSPNATIEALSTQVESLSVQLSRAQPVPTDGRLESTTRMSPEGWLVVAPPALALPPQGGGEAAEVAAGALTITEVPAEIQEEASVASATPPPVAAPTAFPTRAPRPTSEADAAPCQLGQIKGNRNSRIYHVPGGASYPQTRSNVQCFDTEDQAVAAGYRKARN